MDRLPWTVLYSPDKSEDVYGQKEQIGELENYISNYKKEKKKAVMIYGATGCGKTVSVYAVANETGAEVVELNASDIRNKDSINSILGNAMGQMSLFAKTKIILIDEVEGLSGTKDRGGLPAVVKLLEKSVFPVVLTSQNPFEQKLKGIRKKCRLIEFNVLGYKEIYEKLKKICDSENIEYEDTALKGLARRAGGDMRAAINDLQMISGSSKKLTKAELEFISEREQKDKITSSILRIFKSTDAGVALKALDNVDEDIDNVFLWIDENLPREYTKPGDLARAYDRISKADVYKGRIRRMQHWRFLVYIYALLSAGVAVSKDEKYTAPPDFRQSERPLKIWMANMKYQKRKSIAEKISQNSHISTKQALQRDVPYIQQIIRNNKKMGDDIISWFEFDDDEVSWMRK
ncbi:MAG: replication factor C large subunit [Candidatus Nanoarchaeia archaeon]